jgi:flagellar motor switch protein FliG
VMNTEDYRAISGAQKAAILMMALGEEQCTRLFSLMHEDEIKDISYHSVTYTRKLLRNGRNLPIWPDALC